MNRDPVGAQWELRRALARTDQRLGHYDASMRAHVQRRFPPGERPSGSFSNEHRQQPFRIEVLDAKWQIHRAPARPATGRRDRGQVRRRPIEVDLCRCRGAMGIAIPVGAHRPVVASWFVCPAGNTSAHSSAPTRAHEKLPSGQNARFRSGIEKETEGMTLVPTRHRAPQFPLHPYRSRQY